MLISETTRMRGLASYADKMEQTASLLANALANVAAVVVVDVAEKQSCSSATRTRTRGGSAPGRSFRRRIRRSVEDVYQQLGDLYFRRAYRMKYTTFKRLANDLRQSIVNISGQKNGGQSRHGPNWRISPDVRLACRAIRWFTRGSPYDIMTTFGIGHTNTFNSFWYVVEAVNKHPNFVISYPDDHDTQRAIAEGFFKVSRAGFKCCAGAIDGILIWTHKSSKKDYRDAGCSTAQERRSMA